VNVPFRLWVLLITLLCAAISAFGLQPGYGGMPWPVAALWAAAAFAAFGLSVWVAFCLIVLGVLMDFMTEAPIGAWPLAILSAYGVALVAWDRQPPVSVWAAEAISVIGGMIAAAVALWAAGAIARHVGFSRAGFMGDFIVTAITYLVVRFVLLPADIRSGKSSFRMSGR
jgi:hypothetical protein